MTKLERWRASSGSCFSFVDSESMLISSSDLPSSESSLTTGHSICGREGRLADPPSAATRPVASAGRAPSWDFDSAGGV